LLAVASLVLAPHVLVAHYPPFGQAPAWNRDLVAELPAAWCWLMVLPAFACIHQIYAYWYTRDRFSSMSVILTIGTALAFSAIAVLALAEGLRESSAWKWIFGFLAIAPVSAAAAYLVQMTRRTPAATQRLLRTKRLSYGLWVLAIFAGLALLDWGTWQVTKLVWKDNRADFYYKAFAAAMVLAAIGRIVLPAIQRWINAEKAPRINVQRLLNIIGVFTMVLVAVMWTTALRIWLFPGEMRSSYAEVN